MQHHFPLAHQHYAASFPLALCIILTSSPALCSIIPTSSLTLYNLIPTSPLTLYNLIPTSSPTLYNLIPSSSVFHLNQQVSHPVPAKCQALQPIPLHSEPWSSLATDFILGHRQVSSKLCFPRGLDSPTFAKLVLPNKKLSPA